MSEDIWMGDSGASTHMGNCEKGMFEVREVKESVKIGNGKSLEVKKVGKKRVTIIQKDGRKMDCVLDDYKFVPELWINLFSITKALKNNWNLGNEGQRMVLSKGRKTIEFDRDFATKGGHLQGVTIQPRENKEDGVAMFVSEGKKATDVNKLHAILGHCGRAIVEKTAKKNDWKLEGEWKVCEECEIAKAKQKPIAKETTNESKRAGERLFVDISSVLKASGGGRKFWILAVDDKTDYCWSYFVKSKSELPEKIISLIKSLEAKNGVKVEKIRLDDAGENVKLKERCEKEGLGVTFEFTSPNSPQYNGKVERKFATIYSRMRAMLKGGGFNEEEKYLLWCEAARHGTDLENMTVRGKESSVHEEMFGEQHRLTETLRCFGDVGVVANLSNRGMKGKLEDRGKVAVYLGWAHDHAGGVCRLMNPETKRVMISRNVRWLERSFGEWREEKQTVKRKDIEVEWRDDPNDQPGTEQKQAAVPPVESLRIDTATPDDAEANDEDQRRMSQHGGDQKRVKRRIRTRK